MLHAKILLKAMFPLGPIFMIQSPGMEVHKLYQALRQRAAVKQQNTLLFSWFDGH